jgi:hypothetical protein
MTQETGFCPSPAGQIPAKLLKTKEIISKRHSPVRGSSTTLVGQLLKQMKTSTSLQMRGITLSFQAAHLPQCGSLKSAEGHPLKSKFTIDSG